MTDALLIFDKESCNLEWEAIAKQIIRLNRHRKNIEKKYKELTGALKAKMGDAEYVYDHMGVELITWKTNEKRYFDAKAFQAAYPDLHEEFCEMRVERRFLTK